tara:strand:+ start:440 stop:673 length:234 start_codon:yes stop_codon:yes gene_type:complete
MDRREGDQRKRQWVNALSKKENNGITITTELVGIKNLKTTGNYRLEFDVFEIDTDKVKELINKLNKPFMMALVEYDE